MTEKEALRQSLLQRFAERQRGGYVPGMPIGVVVPGNHFPSQGVPVPAGYTAHRQQYVQSIVDAAAMRVSTAFTVPPQQQVRPMPIPRPQASVPVSRVEYYTGRNQRQRTTGLTLYEQVQQMQAQRNATSGSTTTSSDHTQSRAAPTGDLRTISALTPDTGTSTARNELERQAGQTESARNHPDASTSSRQSSNSESASERNSAESILRESTRVQTSAPSTSVASTSVTDRDVQAIAPLAEKTPTAARHVWNHASSVLSPNDSSSTTNPESSSTQSTSFLTPSGTSSFLSPSDSSTSKSSKSSAAPSTSFLTLNPESADKSPTTVERAAETASHSMSFLSPTDFNVEETSLSSRQDLEATSRTGQINSNVSLVTVKVTRRRLYLTLGVQGTLIAVTSFVPDEFGRPGEVEVSGKVLPGDVLVRVNSTYIRSGMTPGNVAEIVNATPRPMTLWFERASWDILDGKA
ncbi:hypothetical protein ON010_g17624 [Phytophthora cinnamomi]|nr:hypothetical protein ON010_g17624 [Phytophthora cinnamomi]